MSKVCCHDGHYCHWTCERTRRCQRASVIPARPFARDDRIIPIPVDDRPMPLPGYVLRVDTTAVVVESDTGGISRWPRDRYDWTREDA